MEPWRGGFTMPSSPETKEAMPTYEYLCQECGERLEVFQKFSDKPLRVHPECGGKLQKVFHASGIVFKGSGYYVTDSRPKSSSESKKSDTKGEKTKKKKSGSKESSKASGSESKSSTDSAAASG